MVAEKIIAIDGVQVWLQTDTVDGERTLKVSAGKIDPNSHFEPLEYALVHNVNVNQ